MASLTLQVSDESLLSQLKKACMLLKGVTSVTINKSAPMKKEYDITKTEGYKEAMEDVKAGRVTQWDSLDDFIQTGTHSDLF